MRIRVYVATTNGERTATAEVIPEYDPLLGQNILVVHRWNLHGFGAAICRFCSKAIQAGVKHKTRLNMANPQKPILEIACEECYLKDMQKKPLAPVFDPSKPPVKFPSELPRRVA